jgi:hypothetical protein
MQLSRLLIALVVTGLSLPSGLAAQESGAPAALLLEMDTGDRIRVLAPPDTMVEGRVASVYVRSIVLNLDGAAPAGEGAYTWSSDFESIDAVWTQGRQTWLGAAIGAGAGLVIGGLAMWVGSGLCEYECDSSAGDYVLGSVLFGGAGALVGALVGSAFPRWSLQYER